MTEATELGKLIGDRVRRSRTERGWILDELAERSGVSRRMLVNVEQGATNPSIGTLLRISDALGVGLPVLVDVERSAATRVTRSGQAPVLWHGTSGGCGALVAGTGPPDVVELWDWSLAAGETHRSEPHTEGTRELLLVLDGQVELQVGPDIQLLGPGDAAAFDGDVPHSYANSSRRGEGQGGDGQGRDGQGRDGQGGGTARFALTVFEPHVGSGGAR